jgi:hypothetical protein
LADDVRDLDFSELLLIQGEEGSSNLGDLELLDLHSIQQLMALAAMKAI